MDRIERIRATARLSSQLWLAGSAILASALVLPAHYAEMTES